MDSALPIINKTYEVYKHFSNLNDHLTKRWRLTLGNSIEANILLLIEQFAMAKNATKTMKTPYLLKASALLETLNLKLRLILELKIANETNIFQLQASTQEIGRMLGGWLKASLNM